MIRKFYMAEGDGGGEPATKKPLSSMQKKDWNEYLDFVRNNGGSVDEKSLASHKKENPESTVTNEMISDGKNQKYYPTYKRGGKDYGTDKEAYDKDMAVRPRVPVDAEPDKEGDSGGGSVAEKRNTIPLPNYEDTTSRINYLKQWQKKYGDLQKRGDTVLRVNDVPRGGSTPTKKMAENYGKEYKIDPSLLYASAMEEGMSGLYKNLDNTDTRGRKPTDFGYLDYYGDKEFPINGGNSFGLPDFAKRFPELVHGGYLPKDFQSRFRGTKAAGEFSENDFKTAEDAMKAKAAMMKFGQDFVDKEAKKHGVELSEKQREFFTLAFFNGGEGAVYKRLPEYAQKGYLKNDDFIYKRPKEEEDVKGTFRDVWGHVSPRMKMSQDLKNEKLFE